MCFVVFHFHSMSIALTQHHQQWIECNFWLMFYVNCGHCTSVRTVYWWLRSFGHSLLLFPLLQVAHQCHYTHSTSTRKYNSGLFKHGLQKQKICNLHQILVTFISWRASVNLESMHLTSVISVYKLLKKTRYIFLFSANRGWPTCTVCRASGAGSLGAAGSEQGSSSSLEMTGFSSSERHTEGWRM